MTKIEYARFQAYALAMEHLKNHTAITDSVPVFKKVYDNAAKLLERIADADQVREAKKETSSAGKQQFKNELVRKARIVAGAIVTYAGLHNDQGLRESMTFSHTELARAKDTDLASLTANILEAARQLNGQLKDFGISDELLQDYTERVTNYSTQANKPRRQVAEIKVAGDIAREDLLSLRKIFDQQLDSLMLQFEEKHPEFYITYHIKRTIIYPGHRKTKIDGLVTDARTGDGIANAQISIKGSPLTVTTQPDGSFILTTKPLHNATLECTCEGFKTVSLLVEVKLGQSLKQEIIMEKI